MKRKYRIVTDTACGFEVQVKYWWWPFWAEACWTNSHNTPEDAMFFIERHKAKAVWEEGVESEKSGP